MKLLLKLHIKPSASQSFLRSSSLAASVSRQRNPITIGITAIAVRTPWTVVATDWKTLLSGIARSMPHTRRSGHAGSRRDTS